MGRFPSGQREQTVNLPSTTSVVRIHPYPPKHRVQYVPCVFYCPKFKKGGFERALRKRFSESFLARGSNIRSVLICIKIDFAFSPYFATPLPTKTQSTICALCFFIVLNLKKVDSKER